MDKNKLALAITKSLAYTENGGKPDINHTKAGKTGELKSLFQFTPDTWRHYSKQITGEDNFPLTAENEAYVTHNKVLNWVEQGLNAGKNPNQIALEIGSMWNAGEHKPEAYKENWKGTNKKYGIAYDTPKYADEVANYTKEFLGENNNHIDSSGTALSTTPTPQSESEKLNKVLAMISQNQNRTPEPIQNNALSPKTGLMQKALADRGAS